MENEQQQPNTNPPSGAPQMPPGEPAGVPQQEQQPVQQQEPEEHAKVSRKFKRMAMIERYGYGARRTIYVLIGLGFFVIVFVGGYMVIRAVLPEPDADNDGVPDTVDQCPGEDDTVDEDQDGIPDGCDDAVPPITFDEVGFQDISLIEDEERLYDVAFTVTNSNTEWGVDNLRYRVNLLGESGDVLKTTAGTSYVAPASSTLVIESRVATSEAASSASVEILSGDWKRKLTGEEISLEIREQVFTPQNASGIATFTAVIENDSNFNLDRVDIKALITDTQGEVISTNFTVVNTLVTDEVRFFELRWDRSFTDNVSFDVTASTNILNNSNLLKKQGEQTEF